MWSCRMFLASEEPLYKTTIDGKGEEGGRTTEKYNTQVTKGKKAKGFFVGLIFSSKASFSACVVFFWGTKFYSSIIWYKPGFFSKQNNLV